MAGWMAFKINASFIFSCPTIAAKGNTLRSIALS
jgi:hypothetical protein